MGRGQKEGRRGTDIRTGGLQLSREDPWRDAQGAVMTPRMKAAWSLLVPEDTGPGPDTDPGGWGAEFEEANKFRVTLD